MPAFSMNVFSPIEEEKYTELKKQELKAFEELLSIVREWDTIADRNERDKMQPMVDNLFEKYEILQKAVAKKRQERWDWLTYH